MHLNAPGSVQNGMSNLQATPISPPSSLLRPRPATVLSVPLRDDFDAYTYTDLGHRVSVTREDGTTRVSEREDDHAQIHYIAGSSNDGLTRRSTTPVSQGTLNRVRSRRVGMHRVPSRIGDEGTMEFVARKVTPIYPNGVAPYSHNEDKFEMVQEQVLEDNPERTITMWREKVARTASNDDGASIATDSHVNRRQWLGSDGSSIKKTYGSLGISVPESINRARSISGGYSSSVQVQKRDVELSPKAPTAPSIASSATSRTRVRPRSRASSILISKTSHTHSRSRTPTHSTSRATSASSIEFVLSTCQPSLLHIAPVLTDLGIFVDEHLKALGRMNEATRDREVKEVALRRGVTVVEWAMLMDRIKGML